MVAGGLGDAVVTATATDGSRISASVNVHVVEDPDAIKEIQNSKFKNQEGDIYDLSGRKIDSSLLPLKKGVYIVNGKKKTVK